MQVAIYIPSLRGGGAERAMVTLANGMAEKGIQIDLVLASAEGPYLSEVSPKVRIIDLKSKRVFSSLLPLIRYLRKEQPQAMLSALNHANVIAVLARMLSGVSMRLIVSERNNVSLSANSSKGIRARAVLPMMRWAYRKADGVVAVSNGVADDLARTINLSRERITVVYNPVVTEELLARAKEPLNHPWIGENKPLVILGVGRLNKQKDFPTLIKAFAKVRAVRDCRLVILGDGELRSELEALVIQLGISDSVQLPGFSDNPFAWMSKVNLFVLSSAWEGLPNALIQAIACGAPVISTDCPSGPDEILEGGKWGALVPVGSVEAMALEIERALNGDAKPAVERANFFSLQAALNGFIKIVCVDNNKLS